jgi:glucokinase
MAYLGVDIGGTKTLFAVLDDNGVIQQQVRFATPREYHQFIDEIKVQLQNMNLDGVKAAGAGVPAKIDRKNGVALKFGNLPWENVHIKEDFEQLFHCPTVIENDANVAGLSEAMLLKNEYRRVVYLTVSTGIGDGVIINGVIDEGLADSEPGQMEIEHNGKIEKWEDFASGRAIVKEYGKEAHEITDPEIWHKIAANLAPGLLSLIAITQPQVIVFGGAVGAFFEHFQKPLLEILKEYSNPMVPIPELRMAGRPEEAVIYGCYDLAKATYGTAR